jgi:DNA (cytosine-5)-methyltransferase 1
MTKQSQPVVVEVFCGAGGTSFGFAQAGFDVRLGIDVDSAALDTFKRNHPGAVALAASVTDRQRVNGDQIRKLLRRKSVDVLIGGPSCQGYSTIGKRMEEDPRNQLYSEYIRLVQELKPKWLLFENVKGMLLYGKGRFVADLKAALERVGYRTEWRVLNAADYGVPQRRERLFVIGCLAGIEPSFPAPTHADPRCDACRRGGRGRPAVSQTELFAGQECPTCGEFTASMPLRPWVSVGEAIGDLPALGASGGTADFVGYTKPPDSAYQREMRKSVRGYDLHLASPISDFAMSIVRHVAEGHGLRSVPMDNLPARFKRMRRISDGSFRRDCTTLYHRLSRKLPSYTITCNFSNVSSGAFVHPLENRAITVREAARLQSFPDRFIFNPSHVKRQIGNAVPPLLAKGLAEHMLALESRHACRPRVRSTRASAV